MRNRFHLSPKKHRNRARESACEVEVPAARLGSVFAATHRSTHCTFVWLSTLRPQSRAFVPAPVTIGLFFFLRGSIAAFLVGICCRSLRFVLSDVYFIIGCSKALFICRESESLIVWKVDVYNRLCIYCHSMMKIMDSRLVRCSQSTHQVFVSVDRSILLVLPALCISITPFEALYRSIPIRITKVSNAVSRRIMIICRWSRRRDNPMFR